MTFENMTEWIDYHMKTKGREWVNKNLAQCAQDMGKEINPDSYMVCVRKVKRRIEKKLQISTGKDKEEAMDNPAKLKTPTEMADEHKLDLTKFSVEKVVLNEWGHPDNRSGQTKIYATKDKPQFDPKEECQKFLDEIKKHSPVVDLPGYPESRRRAFFIQMPDLHFGKLARAVEVGETYNMVEADRRAMTATAKFCEDAKVHRPEIIYFNLGGDLLNTDSNGKTTTKGTPQDEESSIYDTQRKAAWLVIKMVLALAEHAPVEVLMIPGNHDEIRSWFLGHAIEMFFWNDSRVKIDNREVFRKYIRFGTNLLGAAHGEEDAKKLPFLMAQENPLDWGQCRVREFFLGHHHKIRKWAQTYIDEDSGVRVIRCPSVSGTDKWHFKSGWIGAIKEAQNHIYDFALGKVAVSICEFLEAPVVPSSQDMPPELTH
jgi:hypothetical protein